MPMFNKERGEEFQCLIKQRQNSSVRKDDVRIPILFKKIEFQWKKGYGQSCNVHKNRAWIPVLERVRSQCQCLQ